MAKPVRSRLHVESLESREVPDGSPVTENFNSISPPSLPAGWGSRTNDGSVVFTTAAGLGLSNSVALVTSAASRTSGLTWYGTPQPGDTAAAVWVRADSLVPAFVFVRGQNLDTSTPSYLAAVVTRGLKVEIRQVTRGATTVLGTVSSPPAAYLSGQWVRVTIVPMGDSVAVHVTRQDTGQFLNANGRWQTAATVAVRATTTLPDATGRAGIGRAAAYTGAVRHDDFSVVIPPGVEQSFDTTPAGTTPVGWQTWTSGAPGTLGVTTTRALSPTNGFASTGGSTTAARAWVAATLPADLDASAAVFVDSLIPGRVFLRGSGLDTSTPTYYAAQVTRGLKVSLVRVVDGVETTLGAVQSSAYLSGQWVRLRVIAEGDRLRVVVYRADTRQWLTSDGTWSASPDFVLEKMDGAIADAGNAGVARVAAVSGALTFDDFAANPIGAAAGPVVSVAPVSGSSPFAGDVTFRATATGNPTRIEFRLNGVLRSASATSTATWTLDTTVLTNDTHTLTVRAFDAAGNIGSADYTFTTANAGQTPISVPTIPRHYSHIRIAQLAYSGNPMGTFEQSLLRTSVDLVIPNVRYLSTIESVAPNTPQLIYSNVSNLYQGLLTDWLAYADRAGVSRELAFYHVSKATAFTGTSASSQPVNWLWGVFQTSPGGSPVDVTSAARGGRNFNVSFGGAGTTTAFGYTDAFRELNVSLVSGAAAGWSGVWEYATATDAAGNPTAWKALAIGRDGTNGLTQDGRITFDPPADWVPSKMADGGSRLYSVRFRVTAGTADQDPELKTVFGRDYVSANGTYAGTIPAFDYSADANGDGYLTDTEYATRTGGLEARFAYESRLFYPFYGQMRFVTNTAAPAVRRWAADYHVRLLDSTPLADGIFMDNATGRVPFRGVAVLEPTASFSTDSAAMLAAISRAIEPKWILANTAGGREDATPNTAAVAGTIEEFLLRPMQANWSEFGDAANLINLRLATTADGYLVIDTHPAGGSTLDSRTQLAALASYYLVADPERTMLMFFGGYNPATSWNQHWSQAAAVNVGQPAGDMRVFATGADPSNTALTYRVLARDYGKGLVLYKPLSYARGVGEGTTANATWTTHQLGGSYRAVNANGTMGPVISAITLRNGEGAVLIKA